MIRFLLAKTIAAEIHRQFQRAIQNKRRGCCPVELCFCMIMLNLTLQLELLKCWKKFRWEFFNHPIAQVIITCFFI